MIIHYWMCYLTFYILAIVNFLQEQTVYRLCRLESIQMWTMNRAAVGMPHIYPVRQITALFFHRRIIQIWRLMWHFHAVTMQKKLKYNILTLKLTRLPLYISTCLAVSTALLKLLTTRLRYTKKNCSYSEWQRERKRSLWVLEDYAQFWEIESNSV